MSTTSALGVPSRHCARTPRCAGSAGHEHESEPRNVQVRDAVWVWRLARAAERGDFERARALALSPRVGWLSRRILRRHRRSILSMAPSLEAVRRLLPVALEHERPETAALGLYDVYRRYGSLRDALNRSTPQPVLDALLRQASFYAERALVTRLLEWGADPDAVLGGGDGSVMRIHGDVIRALVRAGGTPSPAIRALAEGRHLIGDR